MRRKEQAVRIFFAILLLVILASCLTVLVSGRAGRWVYFNQGMATALALTVPFLLEIGRRLHVPPTTKAILLGFIFAGLFLGSVNGWYYRLRWWDSMLHFLSGPMVGILAYSIVLAARARNNDTAGFSHGVALLLIFCFIMTIGTVWEIVEYTLDNTLGMNMQRHADGGGLSDTMSDILFNTLGALLFTVLAHVGLKGRLPFLARLAIRPGSRSRFVAAIPRAAEQDPGVAG